MRVRALSLAFILACVGCARILGIDFDSYSERQATGPQLQCVPREISRCLCELDEGVRTCDEAGQLGPCICDAGTSDPCGNGGLDEGEACEDGNRTDGDGCSASCVPDGRPFEVAQCPGQDVIVWPGRTTRFSLVGALQSIADEDGGTCQSADPPDRILALSSNIGGRLQVIVEASVATFVSLRLTCEAPSSLAACARVAPGERIPVAADVAPGQVVYLIVQPTATAPTVLFSFEATLL